MSATLAQQFRAARRVSTPLMAIATPDPVATMGQLREVMNGDPRLAWDCVRGLSGANDKGIDARANLSLDFDTNLVEVLVAIIKLPDDSVVFIHNAGKFLDQPPVLQALANLRDTFKQSHKCVVLLGPAWTLPPELANDVLVIDEPLPDAEQLEQIVRSIYQAADREPDTEAIPLAIEAVQGLAAFPAEQATAMAMVKAGLDFDSLWERKRQLIEQTPGLKVYRGGDTFQDIGGVDVLKSFLSRVVKGKSRPNAVVFIDEIEKAMAGSAHDTSGVSQDQLGTLLSYMQDTGAVGVILVGPPGAAKSAVAKAAGNEAGIPTIQLDLGSMRGSLVGQSEQQLRSALKVISAVSNAKSLWIATCNQLASLPPELRRRFTLGIYMVDLPDTEERRAIWNIWLAKYELTAEEELPDDEGWTGAEIKQACDLAWRLDCDLVEAARFVVPVSRSAADQLDRLRTLAEGKFLSASHPGVYRRKTAEQHDTKAKPKNGRKILAE